MKLQIVFQWYHQVLSISSMSIEIRFTASGITSRGKRKTKTSQSYTLNWQFETCFKTLLKNFCSFKHHRKMMSKQSKVSNLFTFPLWKQCFHSVCELHSTDFIPFSLNRKLFICSEERVKKRCSKFRKENFSSCFMYMHKVRVGVCFKPIHNCIHGNIASSFHIFRRVRQKLSRLRRQKKERKGDEKKVGEDLKLCWLCAEIQFEACLYSAAQIHNIEPYSKYLPMPAPPSFLKNWTHTDQLSSPKFFSGFLMYF